MTNYPDDGGPAYPSTFEVLIRHCDSEEIIERTMDTLPGQSLRDDFAKHAMAALIRVDPEPWLQNAPAWVAEKAYRYADAMLAARKAGEEVKEAEHD